MVPALFIFAPFVKLADELIVRVPVVELLKVPEFVKKPELIVRLAPFKLLMVPALLKLLKEFWFSVPLLLIKAKTLLVIPPLPVLFSVAPALIVICPLLVRPEPPAIESIPFTETVITALLLRLPLLNCRFPGEFIVKLPLFIKLQEVVTALFIVIIAPLVRATAAEKPPLTVQMLLLINVRALNIPVAPIVKVEEFVIAGVPVKFNVPFMVTGTLMVQLAEMIITSPAGSTAGGIPVDQFQPLFQLTPNNPLNV
jgi:hypothetical protein